MMPVVVSVTGTGTSGVVTPDWMVNPFAIGIGCSATGTVTYTVQHTFDDVTTLGFNAASATWYSNSGITAQTASKDGNYAFPVRGIRLNVLNGTGIVTATFMQATNSPW